MLKCSYIPHIHNSTIPSGIWQWLVYGMGAGELYHAYHRISVKEAEKELHRLEEKLGRKATEKIAEDGVKYVNLRGFFME